MAKNNTAPIKISRLKLAVVFLLVSGCTVLFENSLDTQYGSSHFIDRVKKNIQSVHSWQEATQVLNKRCVVCHGCYDAPCQLRLGSIEGIERGAHKDKVYNGKRLFAASPTRLFDDAYSVDRWRAKGFFPVLNERQQTAEANVKDGLMARMLALKQAQPLPSADQLPTSFTFSLKRKQQCPTIEAFDTFAKKYPLWGMPYGLPALSKQEHNVLINWIQQGSPHPQKKVLTPHLNKQVTEWEEFLNGVSLKQQLMSRYLYEHLFISNLYFPDDDERLFFRLVRSTTAPGQDIDLIATRRPYDDPNVERFYYRLQRVTSAILAKTHIPYALHEKRMQRISDLFLTDNYDVNSLPSYDPGSSANPFVTFIDIPEVSRYRFLLDDAQASISGFIKGPVCRGQLALDVINDHFWVFFINPNSSLFEHDLSFLSRESNHLRLPAEKGSGGLSVLSWLKYSQFHKTYLLKKNDFLVDYFTTTKGPTLNLVWDGDTENTNAALTVFRHFDSASIVKGLVGHEPKTSWLIDYPLLERIHYLLVAGFDVYGNARHQLNARLYMDFLRMEGEYNFLSLLPKQTRKLERDLWYRGAHDYVKKYITWGHEAFNKETAISFRTKNHKSELYQLLRKKLGVAVNDSYSLGKVSDPIVARELDMLSQATSKGLFYMPELSFLMVTDAPDGNKVFSIIRNSMHSNISHLFSEQTQRLPEEDTLTIANGFVGAYPNVFYKITKFELAEFVTRITTLSSEDDYQELLDRFGVRRTAPDFWVTSDLLHAEYQKLMPIEAGLFDYNRLENR